MVAAPLQLEGGALLERIRNRVAWLRRLPAGRADDIVQEALGNPQRLSGGVREGQHGDGM
jgi:hypothetical protein